MSSTSAREQNPLRVTASWWRSQAPGGGLSVNFLCETGGTSLLAGPEGFLRLELPC
jgi:hypothetical protein